MKEVIINKALVIKPEDNQTNIPIRFTLNKEYSKMIIQYQYGPSHASAEESYRLVKEALRKYYSQDTDSSDADINKNIPVENLVTLSMSYDGKYVGARHTKERIQEVTITQSESSLGFPAHPIYKGEWEVQLNVHCIASEKINAFITVTVEGVV